MAKQPSIDMPEKALEKKRTTPRRDEVTVVLRNIPPGYNWGWYTREDPRMHLQTVDKKHRGSDSYKIWLENKGRRVIEPVGKIPAKVLKSVVADLTPDRLHVEAQWAGFMIEAEWIQLAVALPIITVIAYPRTPNSFARTIDLQEHMGPIGLAKLRPEDVGLNAELAALELWPTRDEGRRWHISLAEILWQD